MVGEFTKILIHLRQWLEWNFWRAIDAQCVRTFVGTVFFGKTP